MIIEDLIKFTLYSIITIVGILWMIWIGFKSFILIRKIFDKYKNNGEII